jgi:hypothetical protein
MAKTKKHTIGIKRDPELTRVDKAIRRINTDLKRAAQIFGEDSSQVGGLQSYASTLMSYAGDAGVNGLRTITDSNGVSYVQLPRSRAVLEALKTAHAGKLIKKMEQIDLKKQKAWAVKQWEERTGQVAKSRAEKEQAVQSFAAVHGQLNASLESLLHTLYAIASVTGDDSAAGKIRALSRGQWTTAAAKREMIAIAEQEIAENSDIIDDFAAELGLNLQ